MDPSPFDRSDAEVVLRTSDEVTFRVYSRILAEASPFFRDLLTLPQPPADKDDSAGVVHVSETSEVMHTLLKFVYPIEDPPVETLSLLGDVLAAALKYDLGVAVQTLRRLLVSPEFVEKESLRVYAIACRHGLHEEAKVASRHTLSIDILDAPPVEEFKFITAYDYQQLIQLHRTRSKAARQLIKPDPTISCTGCGTTYRHDGAKRPSQWWDTWSTLAEEELQHRPATHVIFSFTFLAQSMPKACQYCGTSCLKSHEAMSALRKSIDELPSTI